MAKSKLTDADKKFIDEFLNGEQLKKDFKEGDQIKKANRFSGVSTALSPISAAAFDFVINVEFSFNNNEGLKRIHPKLTVRNAVSKFDRARYIVMKLDPEAYMTLLD